MKTFICILLAHLCLHSALAAEEECGSVLDAVDTACDYPSKLVLVSSPAGEQVDSENCDAEYQKGEWKEEPRVKYPEAEAGKKYTLLSVDPDAPGYEKGQYYLHWMVSNIRGEDFVKGDLSKANHLQGYYGPNPPAGSGLHRYMFLAFPEGEGREELEVPSRRSRFELSSWLRRQQKLCAPSAGIQFRTQF